MEGHRTLEAIAYQEEVEFRASERNRHRPFWDRLFRRNLTTEEDVAHEEALWFNEMVVSLLSKGKIKTAPEASNVIDEMQFFKPKSDGMIVVEEEVRAALQKFDKNLRANDFNGAEKILGDMSNKYSYNSKPSRLLEVFATPIFNRRVAELFKARDGENIVALFDHYLRGNRDRLPKGVTTNEVTPEDLHAPEVQKAIQNYLIARMHARLEDFIKSRDMYVRLGIVDTGHVNQLPEIQEIARQELVESVHDIWSFAGRRDKLARAGILNAEEANKMPELIQEVRRSLTLRELYSTESYIDLRDQIIQLGIADRETIEGWVQSAQPVI